MQILLPHVWSISHGRIHHSFDSAVVFASGMLSQIARIRWLCANRNAITFAVLASISIFVPVARLAARELS